MGNNIYPTACEPILVIMAQLLSVVLSLLVGIISIIFVFLLLKWRKHFILKDLRWNGFNLMRFSTSFIDLTNAQFPKDSANSSTLKSFKGKFVVEIVGFKFKFSNFKLVFNVDSINIYVNSSAFKSTRKRQVVRSKYVLSILRQQIYLVYGQCR